ncbi:MAG: IMP dehydrogenase, partial [Dehalococcoidia bacterium]
EAFTFDDVLLVPGESEVLPGDTEVGAALTRRIHLNIPLVSAWTNDSGFGSIFAEQLEPWLEEGDVLIGLSVHGGSGSGDAGPWSQNLLQAVKLARERRARVIGFSGFGGGGLKELSDECLVIPVDEEPLGTPLVEAYHVLLHHLVCTALKLRMAETGSE